MCKSNRKAAFTLVEFAIVITIISILATVIMVGKDLISSAQVRSRMAQINEFTAATSGFAARFNCLPGDCPDATEKGLSIHPGILAQWPGTESYANGDGNGLIGGPRDNQSVVAYWSYGGPAGYEGTQEPMNYWWQLSESGFLKWSPGTELLCNPAQSWVKFGTVTPPVAQVDPRTSAGNASCAGWMIVGPHMMQRGSPSNAFDNSGHLFVMLTNPANYGDLNIGDQVTGTGSYPQQTLLGSEAFSMDVKIDDGYPMSGSVRTTGMWNNVTTTPTSHTRPYTGNANQQVCVNDDTTPFTYNLAASLHACNLAVPADF